MIVKRRIPFRNTLQTVIEVDHYFPQRHIIKDLHAIAGNIFLFKEFSAFPQTKRHNGADIIGSGDDGSLDIGFLDMIDQCRVGHTTGIMHLLHLSLFVIYIIRYVGHGSDHIHVEFAIKPFLHDLHVEQSQKTATETKTQCQ